MVTTDWRDMPRFETFEDWTMADPRFGHRADINMVESGAPSSQALLRSTFCCRISIDRSHDSGLLNNLA
jgi:hypothetical protein